MGKLSRRLLEQLKGKGNRRIDEGELRTIAGRFKGINLEDETKLRELIRTLSAISATPVTPETEERLLRMIRESRGDTAALLSMLNALQHKG